MGVDQQSLRPIFRMKCAYERENAAKRANEHMAEEYAAGDVKLHGGRFCAQRGRNYAAGVVGAAGAGGSPSFARSSASMRLYTLRSVRSALMIERSTIQRMSPMRMVGVTE